MQFRFPIGHRQIKLFDIRSYISLLASTRSVVDNDVHMHIDFLAILEISIFDLATCSKDKIRCSSPATCPPSNRIPSQQIFSLELQPFVHLFFVYFVLWTCLIINEQASIFALAKPTLAEHHQFCIRLHSAVSSFFALIFSFKCKCNLVLIKEAWSFHYPPHFQKKMCTLEWSVFFFIPTSVESDSAKLSASLIESSLQ